MSLSQEEREREGSKFLIELSVKGASRHEIGQVIEKLHPMINRQVKTQCSVLNNILETSASYEDVIQEVLIKIIDHPPNRECEPGKERIMVMAWIKTTTRNLLIDKDRRARTRGFQVQDNRDSIVNRQPDPAPRGGEEVARRLDANQKIKNLEEFIRKHYPRGNDYIQALKENPEASGNELAEAMGVSRANLDQIARRTRLQVVRFQELHSSEKEQE